MLLLWMLNSRNRDNEQRHIMNLHNVLLYDLHILSMVFVNGEMLICVIVVRIWLIRMDWVRVIGQLKLDGQRE